MSAEPPVALSWILSLLWNPLLLIENANFVHTHLSCWTCVSTAAVAPKPHLGAEKCGESVFHTCHRRSQQAPLTHPWSGGGGIYWSSSGLLISSHKLVQTRQRNISIRGGSSEGIWWARRSPSTSPLLVTFLSWTCFHNFPCLPLPVARMQVLARRWEQSCEFICSGSVWLSSATSPLGCC